jgi:hypothetical protein
MPLLRLNQLPDLARGRICGVMVWREDGRLEGSTRGCRGEVSTAEFWFCREVRELLKELRRLFREKSLRTDWLDFCCSPLEGFWPVLEGDAGVRKLSARSVSWLEEVEVDIFASWSFSRSGVDGGKKLVWMSSAEVGCDDKGPPPAVGGRAESLMRRVVVWSREQVSKFLR